MQFMAKRITNISSHTAFHIEEIIADFFSSFQNSNTTKITCMLMNQMQTTIQELAIPLNISE